MSTILTHTHTYANGSRGAHNRPIGHPFRLCRHATKIDLSNGIQIPSTYPVSSFQTFHKGWLSYVMMSQSCRHSTKALSCDFNKRRLFPTHIPWRLNHVTLTKEGSQVCGDESFYFYVDHVTGWWCHSQVNSTWNPLQLFLLFPSQWSYCLLDHVMLPSCFLGPPAAVGPSA